MSIRELNKKSAGSRRTLRRTLEEGSMHRSRRYQLAALAALSICFVSISTASAKDKPIKVYARTKVYLDKEDTKKIKKCLTVACCQELQREFLRKRDRFWKAYVRQLYRWPRVYVFGGHKESFKVGGKSCSQFKKVPIQMGCLMMATDNIFAKAATGRLGMVDPVSKKVTNPEPDDWV